MTGLLIAAAILLFFLILLLLPVRIIVRFEDALFLQAKIAFITVYKTKPNEAGTAPGEHKGGKPEEEKERKENPVRLLFQKKGAKEGIRVLFHLVDKIFHKLKRFLRHFTWDKLYFNLSVASRDAAQTAISYGEICTAAYPVFSFLEQYSKVNYKEISIYADFTAQKMKLLFSFCLRARLLFILIFAIGVLHEFLSFRKQVKNDE